MTLLIGLVIGVLVGYQYYKLRSSRDRHITHVTFIVDSDDCVIGYITTDRSGRMIQEVCPVDTWPDHIKRSLSVYKRGKK